MKHAEAMVQRQRESLPPPPPPIYADAGPVVPPAAGPFSPAKSPKKSPKRKSPAKSPAKENASPLRSVMAALTGSPKRTKAPADAALSLDARARKIKDERIARAKAQRGGVATEVPVAKRTRGYKIL